MGKPLLIIWLLQMGVMLNIVAPYDTAGCQLYHILLPILCISICSDW